MDEGIEQEKSADLADAMASVTRHTALDTQQRRKVFNLYQVTRISRFQQSRHQIIFAFCTIDQSFYECSKAAAIGTRLPNVN
ncbi:MAG: hypothetical protein QM796_18545 [Chthoniobacteraceae bacterium]